MLRTMWSRLPCSQDALSTVHHRPYVKTGTAPLSPRTKRARSPGERRERPSPPIDPASMARLAR
jgi:hypothetical protein